MQLIDRVRTTPPRFAGEEIRSLHELTRGDYYPYTRQSTWHDSTTINVNNVVGTMHPSYIGMSWAEFMEKGIRMRPNLAMHAQNPGYYYGDGKKEPSMYYITFDENEFYIGQDGNHRTAIARFEYHFSAKKPLIHGVTLDSHVVDWRLKDLHEQLLDMIGKRGLRIKAETHQTIVGRDDAAGMKVDRFDPKVLVTEFESGRKLLCDATQLGEYMTGLEKPKGFWGRLFGK